MKRKILSLILVFAMTVSLLTVGTGAVEPTYGDTAGHWAESSIERWSGHGIIQGSNGLFDPNGQLTCAQLATILAKLLKLPAAKDAGFTDNTADAWYYDAINRCAAAGILNGNGDGTVTPEAPISRERAMVMLARALGIEPIRKPDLTKYTDAAKVAPYAQGMVAAMIEAGIVGGVTADELAPQDNINRASTVTILDRAIDTYADEAGKTVKADGKGLVLVVADDVTVTGDVDKLLVPANDIEVTVKGSKNIDDITVTGDNSKVILNNSTANDVTLDGKNTELETKSGSKVENVSVTEDAKGATVNAGSGTTIKNVENSAADTTVTGSGTVKNVASDTDITVETKNTNVENSGDSKITVTDAKGKDSTVSATGSGSSTTVNKETTSSGGGGYSHSHSYDTSKWVFDDTKHWHASTCGHNLKIDEAEHTYENDVCTVCSQVKADVAVAKIGSKNYKTLPEAVAVAADGAIVTVVKNISLDSCIVISKKVTVDLNGKTVTRDMSNVSADFTRNEGNLFTIQSAGDLTLKDSTGNGMLTAIAPADNHYSTDTLVLNYGKFTLESGTIKVPEKVYYAVGCYGKDSVTTINGGVIDAQWGSVSDGGIALGSNGSKSDATYGFTLNINGGEIKGGEQTLYLPGAGKTTITGGKLTGSARGIEIRAGELTITGGEISANVARNTDAAANNGASGSYTGALVAVKPASVSASGYVGDIVLNISGGTFTNASGDVLTVVHETATAQDAPAQDVTISVSDGQFTGAFNVGNTVNTAANDKLSITGGTYSSDPTAYVAEGYGVKNENGVYTVTEPAAAINNKKYATLAAAINAAQSGETVKLLRDAIGSGISTPDQGTSRESLTIDFDGHTYTMENPAVGSRGTETQAMHWGRTLGKITLKNGTFNVAQGATDVAMAMQNYINLDAEDMVLDFTNITVVHYAENEFKSDSKWAKYNGKECPMFNNNDENTEIKLTRCTVTLPDDSTLGGNISGTLTLVESTFNGYLCFNSTDGRITVDSGSSIKGNQVRSYFDGELNIVCNGGVWTATKTGG